MIIFFLFCCLSLNSSPSSLWMNNYLIFHEKVMKLSFHCEMIRCTNSTRKQSKHQQWSEKFETFFPFSFNEICWKDCFALISNRRKFFRCKFFNFHSLLIFKSGNTFLRGLFSPLTDIKITQARQKWKKEKKFNAYEILFLLVNT